MEFDGRHDKMPSSLFLGTSDVSSLFRLMAIRDYEHDSYIFLCAVAEGSKTRYVQHCELWTAPSMELSFSTIFRSGLMACLSGLHVAAEGSQPKDPEY